MAALVVVAVLILVVPALPVVSTAVSHVASGGPSGSISWGGPNFAVTTIATSRSGKFVGAVGGADSLYMGLLDGTVLRIDPLSGRVTGSAVLPDGNAAAHLAYYDGALYVGTEHLRGAKDAAPYHVYKIDPGTMGVTRTLPMDSHWANGLLIPFNGYLWAADGGCTLYKIDPGTLNVVSKTRGIAEDELTFDGSRYWGECREAVNVFRISNGTPVVTATGALDYPNRPRGFFVIGTRVYSSGSLSFGLYSMTLRGDRVEFKDSGLKGNRSYPTRDTVFYDGYVFAYMTGPDADAMKMHASVLVYAPGLHLRAVVRLPGPALCADASQHTLFLYGGRLVFVTASTVGHVTPVMGVQRWGGGQVSPMAIRGPTNPGPPQARVRRPGWG